jgi:hypothetical protein
MIFYTISSVYFCSSKSYFKYKLAVIFKPHRWQNRRWQPREVSVCGAVRGVLTNGGEGEVCYDRELQRILLLHTDREH